MQKLNISCYSLLRNMVLLILLSSAYMSLRAEGIQQAAPIPSNDGKPPVMLIINSDDYGNFGTRDSVLSRLYFTIKNPGEMIHLGLSAPYSRGGNINSEDSYTVRIYRDNSITPLIIFNNISESMANVSNYAEAAFGQYADDYNFTPSEAGDYYIEFQLADSDGEDEFYIGYWDFTVTDGPGANATEIPGRVWSRNWAFRTPPDVDDIQTDACGWNRSFAGVLYSYTGNDITNDDGFVTKIDFSTSGFVGLSFNVAFNSTGPGTTGVLEVDRQSIPEENQTAETAEYRIFLNPPDEEVFLSGVCGGLISVGDVQCEGDNLYCVEVTVSQPGQVELILDFNEGSNASYVYQFSEAGTRCLSFPGLYGNGEPVVFNDNPLLIFNYSQGVQHYAAYDVEFLTDGFCVETIRPICNPDIGSILNERTRFLYWDDRMIPEDPLIVYTNNPPRDGREGFLCDGVTPRRWDNFTLLGQCNTLNGTIFDGGTQGYGDSSTINTWWFAAIDTASLANVVLFNCMISNSNNDGCTATLEANVIGGVLPYSYEWSGPNGFTSTEPINIVTFSGEYTLTVTDAEGCMTSCSTTVSDVADFSCEVEGPASICGGDMAVFSANPTGGIAPFTFQWSGPGSFSATEESVELTEAGEYCVTITDANGCQTECCKSLTVAAELSCSVIGEDIICVGETTVYTLVRENVVPPATVQWSGPNGFSATSGNITVSSAGEYCAVITNANGCQTQCCRTLSFFEEPVCSIAGAEQICSGQTTTYTANVLSGTAPFDYQWSGPGGFTATEENVEVSLAGEYCVIITDANGCQTECCQTLAIAEAPSCTVEGPALIIMGETATYTTNVSGGTAPFTYEWTGPGGFMANSENVEVSEVGEYCVTVTDANGCMTQCCQNLSFFDNFSCLLEGPEMICMGDLATYTATVDNGTAPFTYSWSGPDEFMSMEESIVVSEAGEYCTTITDANGVETQCCINLSFFVDISCLVDGPDQICSGQTATYTANITGGIAPFNYEWSGPGEFTSMAESIEVSVAGEYCAIITDANGCQTECCQTLDILEALSCSVEGPTIIAMGETATFTTNVSAGTAPFTYEWSGPGGFMANSENIEVSEAGEYCVTVTDANGCMTQCCQTLTFFDDTSCLVEGPDTICEGDLATYTAVPTSGTAPFSYQWSGPGGFTATSGSVEVSEAGEYCATITDANGLETECCLSLSFFVDISCSVEGPTIIVMGETATYTANVSGGTAPFTYEWSGPGGFMANSENVEVSEAGEYCVTVTDANGCMTQCCQTLSFFDDFSCILEGPSTICEGDLATYTAVPTGGIAPFSYEWTGPGGFTATSESVEVSEAGEYCATITDTNGLETECCLSLSFFDNPSCMIDGPDHICVGETAIYTANVGGGEAPFSYAWTGPGGFTATSESVEVSEAGEYMATVTDANGCETECTKTLDIIDISVELTADNTELILGGETTLTATATACENCTYEWTGPNGIIDEDGPIITVIPGLPLPAANEYVYSVQVSENGLCPASDTITIRVLTFCDPDHIYLPNAFTPNGDNLNDELGIMSNTLELLTEMELLIYNRWGEEIFRTTNPKDTWDGTYRGDPLPPDVYGYYLWVLCPGSGEELVQKGNITLLR